MPQAPIEALDRRVMTAVVDRREEGKKALTALLFPLAQEMNLLTETVQVDELTGAIGMAPFIEKNGKAIAVGQLNGQSYTIETPTINIKRPITCSSELLKRQAGQSVFTNDDVYKQAFERQTTADLVFMETTVENRTEWMVSQLLQGSISYQVEGGASFKVTTAKPGDNTFTVSDLWDGSDPTPLQDILSAEDVVQPFSAPGFDIAICGTNAARAIYKMLEAGTITAIKTDSGVTAGSGDFTKKWQGNGLRYIATLNGIPFYQYAGTFLPDDGGAAEPFIRTDYVEFISVSNPEMRVLYNGAKCDAEAILNDMHVGRRFATSDLDKDAGTYVGYLKARPLPWFMRPDWMVSMKVT